MFIKNTTIKNYRNITTCVIESDNSKIDNHMICAPNMSGKTNTLNAIHFALTGKELDGSNDIRGIMPLNSNDDTITSVTVELANGTIITREIALKGDKLASTVEVNNEKLTNSKADAQIDKELGLLDLSIKAPRGFEIKRFLLNPLYFDTISPSTLRSFFIKLADVDQKQIFEQLPKTTQAKIVENFSKYDDAYSLYDEAAKRVKAVKKEIDALNVVFSLQDERLDNNALTKIISEKTKEFVRLESLLSHTEKYLLKVNLAINDYYKTHLNIEIRMLEKGVGDDVYKEVCYPILASGLPFKMGSYAEKTIVGVAFISHFAEKYGLKDLTVLIDNMESLDNYSLNTINIAANTNIRYIGAKVSEKIDK